MAKMYFPGGVERDSELWSEPQWYEPHTVRYWCRHTKELKGSQVKKAESFVTFDCLHYVGENRFVCLPLNRSTEFVWHGRVLRKLAFMHDYNSSEYLITRTGDDTFECDCQGWQTKARRGEIVVGGANCSHVLGLYYAFKLKRFESKKGSLLLVNFNG